jgi:hypothetical protein
MATLKENFQTGDDNEGSINGTTWKGQTFTPASNYTIGSVELYLAKVAGATHPGTITVGIRTTSGGLPTTTVLCSGTTNGNTLPDTPGKEWRSISFGAGAALTAGTVYCIVITGTGSGVDAALWRYATAGGYAGGHADYYNGSWNDYSPKDFLFRNYSFSNIYDEGTLTVTGTGSTSLPSFIQTMVEGTKSVSATGSVIESDHRVYTELALFTFATGWARLSVDSYVPNVWDKPKLDGIDPNKIWDEATLTWVSGTKGDGRLRGSLLVIAQNNSGTANLSYLL